MCSVAADRSYCLRGADEGRVMSNATASPSADQIRERRTAVGLTQTGAAAVVHSTLRTWQDWEGAISNMHPGLWELFVLKTEEEHSRALASMPGLAGSSARGQDTISRWVREGQLVLSADFAKGWGVSRQALDQAVVRGELFSIKSGNKRFYLESLMHLDRPDVARVCRALGRADGVEKLVFWMREHGGLAGKTAVDAVKKRKVDRVVELAEAWAEENGLNEGADAV